MNKKVVLAGGTGFVGRFLDARFKELGYEVLTISRHAGHIHWDDEEAVISALNGSEMLINLAGKSVDCRYTAKNKAEILNSRIQTTEILGQALLKCDVPPSLWINSSTATIYRHAEGRPMTESTGEIGQGFSVNVATAWEKAFFSFRLPQTRQVALRMAIVLGRDGGVKTPYTNMVKFGLGGKQGSGRQMFSWIHVQDLINIILFIQGKPYLAGVFNCSSANPVTNSVLMRTFREAMNKKFGLPSPKWLLRLGAVLIGTETELVLKSRWVLPERLLEAGFCFEYSEIGAAIQDIVEMD